MTTQEDLAPIIALAKASDKTHVVCCISDGGVHFRAESESACQLIASIINEGRCNPVSVMLVGDMSEAKVIPRLEFIAKLEAL